MPCLFLLLKLFDYQPEADLITISS
jgi:hypothetical protein